LLALWDPALNSLTDLTPAAPAVFPQGVGVLARSGDRSKVLAGAFRQPFFGWYSANAALTIVQLAAVPLGIGTIQPGTVSATGGATLTIRGSSFVNGTAISGKSAAVSFKDANTLSVTAPALTPGPQQITMSNPDGETASRDAAFTAN
jgi:IPT/TIG domain-containing protein